VNPSENKNLAMKIYAMPNMFHDNSKPIRLVHFEEIKVSKIKFAS